MYKRYLPPPLVYLFLLFSLFLALNFFKIFHPLRALAEKQLVIPVKETIFSWHRFFKKDLSSCQLQNEKEISELKTKIASLTEENLSQKRLLSVPIPKNWQFLEAKVIGLEGETFTVALGKEDGVKEGMVAVSGESYLGKVFKVSEKMAWIKMPSFFDDKLVAKVVSAGETAISGKGLLIGRGQGKMKIEQVLFSEAVKKSDLAITTVEGGDLLVGEIEEIVESKGEVFKTALVKRLYNPEDLVTVFLVRGKI